MGTVMIMAELGDVTSVGQMQLSMYSCHMSEMEFHNYDKTVTGSELEDS